MEHRRWGLAGAPVLAACVGVTILAAVLAGLTFNAHLASSDSKLPPPLPPLTDLPQGRGLDWSLAGYRDGQQQVPSPPVAYNAADFGAKGDGVTDDSQALQAAIDAASADPSGGVVYLPPGTFVLAKPLSVRASNVVLRGAGEGSTTIYIPVSLSDIFPGTWNMSATSTSPWAASGSFISFVGKSARSSDRSARLATVAGGVETGASVLPVDATSKFRLGQWVLVTINDDSTGSSTTDSGASELPGSQAVAVESVEAQQAASPLPLLAPAPAVPNGSIAAWVYGDGLAYAGLPGTFGQDEISFSARVSSIGKGWVALDRALPFPVRRQWSCTLQRYEPPVQECGVEQLTIRFKHSPMRPHLSELGFNAIALDAVVNAWVRQVTILNSDTAIRMRGVHRCTVADVTIGVTEPRWRPGEEEVNGHHGISLSRGHANLITRFYISAPFYHDLSLEGGALANVVSAGAGADLNLDLHRSGPVGNLFTALGMGLAQRPFKAGGRQDRGAHAGRGNTFWNLQPGDGPAPVPAPAPQPAPTPAGAPRARRLLGSLRQQPAAFAADSAIQLPDCDFGPLLNFVGSFTGDSCNSTGWLVAGAPSGGGYIINIGSVAGRKPAADKGFYLPSKWAMRGWSSSCYEGMRYSEVDPELKIQVEDIAEAALLPFRLTTNAAPTDITINRLFTPHKS